MTKLFASTALSGLLLSGAALAQSYDAPPKDDVNGKAFIKAGAEKPITIEDLDRAKLDQLNEAEALNEVVLEATTGPDARADARPGARASMSGDTDRTMRSEVIAEGVRIETDAEIDAREESERAMRATYGPVQSREEMRETDMDMDMDTDQAMDRETETMTTRAGSADDWDAEMERAERAVDQQLEEIESDIQPDARTRSIFTRTDPALNRAMLQEDFDEDDDRTATTRMEDADAADMDTSSNWVRGNNDDDDSRSGMERTLEAEPRDRTDLIMDSRDDVDRTWSMSTRRDEAADSDSDMNTMNAGDREGMDLKYEGDNTGYMTAADGDDDMDETKKKEWKAKDDRQWKDKSDSSAEGDDINNGDAEDENLDYDGDDTGYMQNAEEDDPQR